MSLKKLMADDSFALVNNTMWIGIPKVATSSLHPVFKKVSTTYYNSNDEFLNNNKNNNINKLWCIWRDPWERWLSAVIQDYEYKFDKFVDKYKEIAPKFSEGFTPFLENGLNIGQQLFYLYKKNPKQSPNPHFGGWGSL